jgi:hypothetical protein
MRRKPSRPSKKKRRRIWEPAKGADLSRVLRRHPEVQATLAPLKLRIDVDSGIIVGRAYWPCPQPNGTPIGPRPSRTER